MATPFSELSHVIGVKSQFLPFFDFVFHSVDSEIVKLWSDIHSSSLRLVHLYEYISLLEQLVNTKYLVKLEDGEF